ncbi:hypothetical protein [Arabiibacter massiliensis]|uniref:hypothetical protein n=1 Tax=Arabiibacter massiliensis TaxID=1870985 RepID=UPI0009BB2D8C|nr:hypothetical protein [Arabiibacter massiliensis]
MLLGMNVFADNKGLSRVEVVCIAGIACFAVALAAVLGWHMLGLMWQGNDANALNTAQGLANASMAETAADDDAPTAYYLKGANTLAAEPPAAGYNEGDTLVIDGREQHVERGTCLIEIVREDGAPTARWVRASDVAERG